MFRNSAMLANLITMYKRLTQEKIVEIHQSQQSDRLFINLYDALAGLGIRQRGITPEEIWNEAQKQTTLIAQSSVPVFSVNSLHHALCFQFRDIECTDKSIIHQSEQEAEAMAFLVELSVLYQLTVYQRSWENHPYKNYCIAIFQHVSKHPQLTDIFKHITATNDQYEKVFHSEIPEHDYMPAIVKDTSIIKEAVSISMQCVSKLSYGYTPTWLQTFWADLINSALRDTLITDMRSNRHYTVIYGIIGILLRNGVFGATQDTLASFSQLEKPTRDSIRRYISNGFQGNDKTYDKFVTDYVKNHPVK